MRELKFRAWHPKLRYFVYFDSLAMIHHSRYQLVANARESVVYHYWDADEIIQQFTGLLDKNGKEIYEGDLIKFELEKDEVTIREVVFTRGYFAYERVKAPYHGAILMGVNEVCEVVGNICENPLVS